MKIEEMIQTVARFFNDLISAWVPGSVLAVGLVVMHLGPDKLRPLTKLGDGVVAGLIISFLLFAAGHTLSVELPLSNRTPCG